VCIVVGNVGRHEGGEVVNEGRDLLVDVDEKGIRGPATKNLNCGVRNLVKIEGLGVGGVLLNVDHPANESFDWAHRIASSLLMDCIILFTIFLIIKMDGGRSAPMEEDS
jgi:hypothetical protein